MKGYEHERARRKHYRNKLVLLSLVGRIWLFCCLSSLTKLCWTDVVLLERKQLTSGTTWHAAGLSVKVAFFEKTQQGSPNILLDLYMNLEAETGVATGICATVIDRSSD